MFHIEAWEEQYGKGVGSQSGEQHVGVHEKCMGCGQAICQDFTRAQGCMRLLMINISQLTQPSVALSVCYMASLSVIPIHPSYDQSV